MPFLIFLGKQRNGYLLVCWQHWRLPFISFAAVSWTNESVELHPIMSTINFSPQVGIRTFDTELLKILCCPETHQELSLAGASLLDQLNAKIAAGQLRNRADGLVLEKLDA